MADVGLSDGGERLPHSCSRLRGLKELFDPNMRGGGWAGSPPVRIPGNSIVLLLVILCGVLHGQKQEKKGRSGEGRVSFYTVNVVFDLYFLNKFQKNINEHSKPVVSRSKFEPKIRVNVILKYTCS